MTALAVITPEIDALDVARPLPFLRLVPSCDPPYDDERPESERTWPPRPDSGWVQLTLLDRAELQLPPMPPPIYEAVPAALTIELNESREPGDDLDFDRQPTVDGLPDPHVTARRYVRAVLEVLSGQRQARQLAKVTTSEVHDWLESGRSHQAPVWSRKVTSMRLCQPVPGVAEISAVISAATASGPVGPGMRSTAFMMRMAGLDGRWVITFADILQ